jgi:hypothetical protein
MIRILLALAVCAAPLAAQTPGDSTLMAAVRLVTEGQGDSARALVRQRLRQLSPTDTLYAEALFVAGVVAGHLDSATTYFRRVAIEHSFSPWAPQAMLRIAQLAFAQADYATAARSVNRILLDYPQSSVTPHAAYWAARVHLEQNELAPACRFLRQARAGATEDVELANRADFYLQRCAGIADAPDTAATPADTTRRDSVAIAAPPPAQGPVRFAVQVAAVRSVAAADDMMRRVTALGHQPRVVRDPDGLLRIRVGRFATRGAAEALQRTLRDQLGGQPFIVEER